MTSFTGNEGSVRESLAGLADPNAPAPTPPPHAGAEIMEKENEEEGKHRALKATTGNAEQKTQPTKPKN